MLSLLLSGACAGCRRQARETVCGPCRAALVPVGEIGVGSDLAIRAAFELSPVARELVAGLKYRRERRLAGWFAARMTELVPRAFDAITWVPAIPSRIASRGYDHGREIAEALAHRTQVPAVELLARDRSDSRQTGKGRADRLAGPRLVSSGRVPTRVVLVDDVVTTGSTIRAAVRALESAGAERVVGITATATPAPEIRLQVGAGR